MPIRSKSPTHLCGRTAGIDFVVDEGDATQFMDKQDLMESGRFHKSIPTYERFRDEVQMQQVAYDVLKLAPKVFDAWMCSDDESAYGFIVMERMDGTADMLIKSKTLTPAEDKELDDVPYKLYESLRAIGILHGDLHEGNVLYKRDSSSHAIKYVAGDFGSSEWIL